MAGIIWKKLEMTRIIKSDKLIPVTLIKIPELKVAQIKTTDTDWYEALVLEMTDTSDKKEVPMSDKLKDLKKWDIVSLDILDGVELVTVEGISKWKWFAWAMKRWNFHWGPGRVGSKFHRALWSIGTRKPRRTKPGKKMHWHMGTDKVTLKKISLELVNKELNVIAVKWPVPGARNSLLVLTF